AIEFLFYAVAPLIVRKLRNVFLFAAIGLAYHAALVLIGERHVAYTYQFFPSAIWFFAIGILAFFVYRRYRDTLASRPVRMVLTTVALVILVNLTGEKLFFPETRIAYVTLAIACTLPVLHALTQRIWIDRTIGELSYGMYLVHMPVIYAYQYYLGG